MSAAAAIRRLAKEQRALEEERVCDFYIEPLPVDMFEWHFTLQGPPDSPYAKGLYHGALHFPRNYPFAPPDIVFFTRSGRFEVKKNICSSISSYHPELWNPTYTIPLVLVALRIFMSQEEEMGIGLLAKRYISAEEKIRMAEESHSFSCEKCGMSSAHALWEELMKGRPPVSNELEAHVPKIPPKPAAVSVPDAEKEEEEEEEEEEKEKNKDEEEAQGTTCPHSGSLPTSVVNVPIHTPPHSTAVVSPVVGTVASSATAQGTAEQRKEPTAAADIPVDNVSSSQAPVVQNVEAKAAKSVTQESSADAAGGNVQKNDRSVIRLRFGNHVICRVEIQLLNRAIAVCFAVFLFLLVNKYFPE